MILASIVSRFPAPPEFRLILRLIRAARLHRRFICPR